MKFHFIFSTRHLNLSLFRLWFSISICFPLLRHPAYIHKHILLWHYFIRWLTMRCTSKSITHSNGTDHFIIILSVPHSNINGYLQVLIEDNILFACVCSCARVRVCLSCLFGRLMKFGNSAKCREISRNATTDAVWHAHLQCYVHIRNTWWQW